MSNEAKNSSGITPRGNKVLIRPEAIETVTKGGIYLPTTVEEREAMAQMYGEVIAVGPMCWKDEVEARCAAGDRVIFAKYAGEIFPGNDGVKYRLVNARDIVATVDRIAQENAHERAA